MRKILLFESLLLFIVLFSLSGCFKYNMTVERGAPLNDEAIKEIVIGKTTRSDIFKLLGTPHSIFHNQAEFTEGYSIMGYSTVQNRYLSSLDENHYAFLYRFGKASSKTTRGVAVVVNVANTQVKIASNELLLLINKETDIVDDVSYRKEASNP